MNSNLLGPNLELARQIADRFLNGKDTLLNKEAFYMFSIAKFILLKEKIIKKDANNNILFFDDGRYKEYEPIIFDFYRQVLLTGSYKRNNTTVEFEEDKYRSKSEEDAIWCFNKIRDCLAHGNYAFDFDKKCIVIYVCAADNSYALNCNIPINLLNSFTFFIDNSDNLSKEDITKKYKDYIKSITKVFNVKEEDYNNNEFIVKYNPKVLNIDKTYYKGLGLSKGSGNSIENYDYDNENIEYEYDNYTKDTMKYNNDNEYDIDTVDISDKLAIKELCNYAERLIMIRPKTKEGLVKRRELLLEVKELLLLEKSTIDTKELIKEIKQIMGIKEKKIDSYGIVSLYNYMSLVFSQTEDLDYSKLKTHQLVFAFAKEGIGTNYNNVVESIKKRCEQFNENMNNNLSNYEEYKSERYKHVLMTSFINFYNDILVSLGNKNKYIIDSVRNSIEHGNFESNSDGYIELVDQNNQNDESSVNFIAKARPFDLFDLSEQIEAKGNSYLIRDFMEQLTSVVGLELFEETWNNLNKLSFIIFNKDLELDYTMDKMCHEALATVIKKVGIKKKNNISKGDII